MNQHTERLDGLVLFLQRPARELLARCEAQLRRPLLVVSGWRSLQEQQLHYQKGRAFNRETGTWEITDLAQVVTRAVPGTSAHNIITRAGEPAAMALDVAPLFPDGTVEWEPGEDFWDKLYEIAWKVGLDPLGDPIGGYLKMDKGHFEEPAWRYKIDGLGCLLPTSAPSVTA